MPTEKTSKKITVGAGHAPRRKSKGKQHPLHAESLEYIARELELTRTGAYPTAFEIARILRGEAERIRSILR